MEWKAIDGDSNHLIEDAKLGTIILVSRAGSSSSIKQIYLREGLKKSWNFPMGGGGRGSENKKNHNTVV